MFDDIRGDIRLKTYVSYILVACMFIITLSTILIPELNSLYGVGDGPAVNIFVRLTIPFQHGFDDFSAIIHLVFNLILMWVLGTYLEKVLGSYRFLITTLVSFFMYVLFHRILLLIGHGFTPILMSYSGVMFVVMAEGRYVKTRSLFEDYFKTLRGVQLGVWLLLPVLMIFVPLYYNSLSSLWQNIFYGNITHVICGATGVALGLVFRQHIRQKLTQQTRKHYIKHSKSDRLAVYFAFGFPLYLALIFFT
ncbi:rhomboid family intramembrane serine protease [Flavobacteriales bacterium]|nr:rhomboid family intramembrane serine protease [Flavobacteriales bacterium]